MFIDKVQKARKERKLFIRGKSTGPVIRRAAKLKYINGIIREENDVGRGVGCKKGGSFEAGLPGIYDHHKVISGRDPTDEEFTLIQRRISFSILKGGLHSISFFSTDPTLSFTLTLPTITLLFLFHRCLYIGLTTGPCYSNPSPDIPNTAITLNHLVQLSYYSPNPELNSPS